MENSPNLKDIVAIPVLFVVVVWTVFGVEVLLDADFGDYGLYPRSLGGLKGIFTTPFLHSGWEHLVNNSLPMLFLGMGIYYFYRDVAGRIYLFSILITGLWVWAFARPSYHIGASGVVYSFAAFVFVSGLIKRNFRLMALSLLVVFQYGGMIWGVLPIYENVSWESHLLGGITGMMLAIYYRKEGWQADKYDWEEEEDEEEPDFDDWKLPQDRQPPHQPTITYRYYIKKKEEEDE
jgi:membrane associated rhomboid family serine protease